MPLAFDLISTLVIGVTLPVATTLLARSPFSTLASLVGSILVPPRVAATATITNTRTAAETIEMMSQRFFFFLPLPFATCSLPTLAEFRSAVWYVWRLEIVPCVTGKPRPKTAPATQLDRCAKRIGSRVYEKSRDRKRGEMKFDFPFWASAFSAVLQLITVQFRSITGRSPLVPRRVLEECEHGSLRVGDHGHSANVLHGRRRQIKLASELLGLVRGPVAIRSQDAGQPVGRSLGAVEFGGRNASDEMLAVLDVQVVVLGIFLFGDYLPAEKITVKLAGALRIRRAQIGPAQGSIHMGDTDTLVLVRLPNANTAPVWSCNTAMRPESPTSKASMCTVPPTSLARLAASSALA